VHIHVVGDANASCGSVVEALSKLYRFDPMPPHFFLAYDILYEPENTDIIVLLDDGGNVDSYVLVWRGLRIYGIHLWGCKACELLSHVPLERSRNIYVHFYTADNNIITCVLKWLEGLGASSAEVRWYHEMVCTRELFRPSGNENIVTRLSAEHADLFTEFMRSRGVEIDVDTARKLLTTRQYHAMIINNEIASAGAICCKLPEVGYISDVYTKPSYRGRGFATAVTSSLTKVVIDSGSKALLYVEAGNESAKRIYIKLGYRITRILPWVVTKLE
jgi:ribosomal protein S18 acetylase RimI-like enzyme